MDMHHDSSPRYLLWILKPTGYELQERQGEPPPVGSEVAEGELRLRVSKLGPSPLPGDTRTCAYTISIR
jgi:hypothetical protein